MKRTRPLAVLRSHQLENDINSQEQVRWEGSQRDILGAKFRLNLVRTVRPALGHVQPSPVLSFSFRVSVLKTNERGTFGLLYDVVHVHVRRVYTS